MPCFGEASEFCVLTRRARPPRLMAFWREPFASKVCLKRFSYALRSAGLRPRFDRRKKSFPLNSARVSDDGTSSRAIRRLPEFKSNPALSWWRHCQPIGVASAISDASKSLTPGMPRPVAIIVRGSDATSYVRLHCALTVGGALLFGLADTSLGADATSTAIVPIAFKQRIADLQKL